MRAKTESRFLAQVLGIACVAAVVVGHSHAWATGVRLPLALAVFLVIPGFSLVTALRLHADSLMRATIVLGLSLAVDLIGAELLLTFHVATVRNLLLSIGGVSLTCLLVCVASALFVDGRAT